MNKRIGRTIIIGLILAVVISISIMAIRTAMNVTEVPTMPDGTEISVTQNKVDYKVPDGEKTIKIETADDAARQIDEIYKKNKEIGLPDFSKNFKLDNSREYQSPYYCFKQYYKGYPIRNSFIEVYTDFEEYKLETVSGYWYSITGYEPEFKSVEEIFKPSTEIGEWFADEDDPDFDPYKEFSTIEKVIFIKDDTLHSAYYCKYGIGDMSYVIDALTGDILNYNSGICY